MNYYAEYETNNNIIYRQIVVRVNIIAGDGESSNNWKKQFRYTLNFLLEKDNISIGYRVYIEKNIIYRLILITGIDLENIFIDSIYRVFNKLNLIINNSIIIPSDSNEFDGIMNNISKYVYRFEKENLIFDNNKVPINIKTMNYFSKILQNAIYSEANIFYQINFCKIKITREEERQLRKNLNAISCMKIPRYILSALEKELTEIFDAEFVGDEYIGCYSESEIENLNGTIQEVFCEKKILLDVDKNLISLKSVNDEEFDFLSLGLSEYSFGNYLESKSNVFSKQNLEENLLIDEMCMEEILINDMKMLENIKKDQNIDTKIIEKLNSIEKKVEKVFTGNIRTLWADVKTAVKLTDLDLKSSLNKCRLILEQIIDNIYEENIKSAPKKPIFNKIEELIELKKSLEKPIFPERIEEYLHQIRIFGNKGSHNISEEIKKEECEVIISMILESVEWYIFSYSENHKTKKEQN